MRRYIPQRHTYLSELENGVEVPARRSILRIAEALETDGDELSVELLVRAGKVPADVLEFLARIPQLPSNCRV